MEPLRKVCLLILSSLFICILLSLSEALMPFSVSFEQKEIRVFCNRTEPLIIAIENHIPETLYLSVSIEGYSDILSRLFKDTIYYLELPPLEKKKLFITPYRCPELENGIYFFSIIIKAEKFNKRKIRVNFSVRVKKEINIIKSTYKEETISLNAYILLGAFTILTAITLIILRKLNKKSDLTREYYGTASFAQDTYRASYQGYTNFYRFDKKYRY